jgi:predicted metal-dependent phosphoesterase TrpH
MNRERPSTKRQSMNVHFGPLTRTGLSQDAAIVDLHVHTKYSLDCATKPATIAKIAAKKKIGVAITDHNDIKGVLALSMKKDLFLIPGIEVTSEEWKDILFYFETARELEAFYTREILPYKHKLRRIRTNKVDLPLDSIIERAQAHHATMVLPHPFAIKNTYAYFSDPKHEPFLKYIHAIEAANGTMSRKNNMAAYGWSRMINKPITGGSDSHIKFSVGCFVTAAFDHSPASFLAQIRQGNCQVIGQEQRRPLKLATNFAIIKNKLLKNKKIPAIRVK